MQLAQIQQTVLLHVITIFKEIIATADCCINLGYFILLGVAHKTVGHCKKANLLYIL